jgi:hypothetical protein
MDETPVESTLPQTPAADPKPQPLMLFIAIVPLSQIVWKEKPDTPDDKATVLSLCTNGNICMFPVYLTFEAAAYEAGSKDRVIAVPYDPVLPQRAGEPEATGEPARDNIRKFKPKGIFGGKKK